MALEEKTSIDKIEVFSKADDWRHVRVRTKTIVLKDGQPFTESHTSIVYDPGADINKISDAEVKGFCTIYLTAERKAAYYVANPHLNPANNTG